MQIFKSLSPNGHHSLSGVASFGGRRRYRAVANIDNCPAAFYDIPTVHVHITTADAMIKPVYAFPKGGGYSFIYHTNNRPTQTYSWSYSNYGHGEPYARANLISLSHIRSSTLSVLCLTLYYCLLMCRKAVRSVWGLLSPPRSFLSLLISLADSAQAIYFLAHLGDGLAQQVSLKLLEAPFYGRVALPQKRLPMPAAYERDYSLLTHFSAKMIL
jgi:hypothetical protein